MVRPASRGRTGSRSVHHPRPPEPPANGHVGPISVGGQRLRAPAAAAPGSTPAAPSSPRRPWTARSPGGASPSSATAPSRWAAAFSEPATRTAATTPTSRSVARSAGRRDGRCVLRCGPVGSTSAARRGEVGMVTGRSGDAGSRWARSWPAGKVRPRCVCDLVGGWTLAPEVLESVS